MDGALFKAIKKDAFFFIVVKGEYRPGAGHVAEPGYKNGRITMDEPGNAVNVLLRNVGPAKSPTTFSALGALENVIPCIEFTIHFAPPVPAVT